jgi:hypothetical protein
MKAVKPLVLASSVLVFGALSAPMQGASWDETTYFTFSSPVKVPGAVLPAGTYVFRIADSYTSRDIVQIMNPEQTKIYATVAAVPAYRQEPTSGTVITFEGRPAAAFPDAVQTWFYPLTTYGHRFVYLSPSRKQKRIEIGADLHSSVKP